MKKLLLLTLLATLLAACSNGFNKSISEPLTVDELKSHMKDSTFTDFYSYAQKLGMWINQSEIRQAQYGDVTYKQLKKFLDHRRDTSYFNNLRNTWLDEYASLYPNYDAEVDSIMNYWRDYKERYNMDSIVKIEFDRLWKEYYSYSGDVRDVNVGFLITPLKGTVDQLIFRYEMKTKVSNDGSNKINWLDGHRCVATTPITVPRTLYWEADYSDEKKLKYCSSEEVKRDYDFIIEIVNVRINGENYEDKLDAIPDKIDMALKYCTPEKNYYKDDIIREFINPNYQSFYEYSLPLYQAEMRKYSPEVYSLLEAYEESKD